MQQQKQENKRGKNRSGWRCLARGVGALGELLAFLAVVLGILVLPGFLTDSASTVAPRVVRAAHR